MPVPKPRTGESEDDFISRCISSLHKTDPERPDAQIIAICYNSWRNKEKLNPNAHADFMQFYNDFIQIFGEEEGIQKYQSMLKSYNLDVTKSYSSQLTRECLNGVCESFSWATPYIEYIREDEAAKYYKVRALTATLSANRNDYTDLAELERSARTLTWRPLNLNHDPNMYLPFPENRVDWAEYEDRAVEAIIRIHNSQDHIQRALENGDIVNPSIEGEPRGGNVTQDGRKVPKWYNFTALALLEKEVTLPGVPSTYGFEPLFLNESLGRSLVESLSVENNTGKEKEMTEEKEETKEETLLEGQGLYNIDVCGQCKFFTEQMNRTVTAPASTGDPGADNEVSLTTGAIGKGIGICSMDEELKKYDDSACTSGRPRDQTTNIEKTEEGRETTIEKMILESKIEELEEKLLRVTQEKGREIEANVETQKKLVEAMDKNVRAQNELAVEKTKNTRLSKSTIELEEKLGKAEGDIIRFTVKTDGLEKDVLLYKGETTRLEESVEMIKKTFEEMKDDLTRALTKANDESTKRATANQRAINAEESKARAVKEVAILTERVSILTRELSDSVQVRAETARRNLEDQTAIKELREKNEELTGVIRKLKQRLSKIPKEIVIEM